MYRLKLKIFCKYLLINFKCIFIIKSISPHKFCQLWITIIYIGLTMVFVTFSLSEFYNILNVCLCVWVDVINAVKRVRNTMYYYCYGAINVFMKYKRHNEQVSQILIILKQISRICRIISQCKWNEIHFRIKSI